VLELDFFVLPSCNSMTATLFSPGYFHRWGGERRHSSKMNGHWLPPAEFVTLSLSLSANMIPVSITAQRELIYCSCAAHSVSRVAHTRLDFVYLADARERRNLFAIQLISVPRQVGVVIWARKWNSDDSIPGCIARIDKQPDFWRVPLLDAPRFLKICSLQVVEVYYTRWSSE
jgi:hypothetical protein